MAQKKCGHDDVCVECTKAEIAKLEKKVENLKKKLPSDNSALIEQIRKLERESGKHYVPFYPAYPVVINHGNFCACNRCHPYNPVWMGTQNQQYLNQGLNGQLLNADNQNYGSAY